MPKVAAGQRCWPIGQYRADSSSGPRPTCLMTGGSGTPEDAGRSGRRARPSPRRERIALGKRELAKPVPPNFTSPLRCHHAAREDRLGGNTRLPSIYNSGRICLKRFALAPGRKRPKAENPALLLVLRSEQSPQFFRRKQGIALGEAHPCGIEIALREMRPADCIIVVLDARVFFRT